MAARRGLAFTTYGDLSRKPSMASKDEVGGLTRAFADAGVGRCMFLVARRP